MRTISTYRKSGRLFILRVSPGIASYGLAWSVFPFQFGYFSAKDSPLVNDIEVIGTE
jgi:hypothetical protein